MSPERSDVLYLDLIGTSMVPVLEEDDVLEVVPYGHRAIRPGDVLFYLDGIAGSAVVHRVVSVDTSGVRTRGDNAAADDRGRVQRENIVGQVVAARRGRRHRRIAGGRLGQLVSAWCRLRRSIAKPLRPLAGLPGRWLAGKGAGLPAKLRPRLVPFSGPKGVHWRMLLGRHVIATYRPRARAWQVRMPFRLFLDPSCLPMPDVE